jgi:phosphatidylcholine synthase
LFATDAIFSNDAQRLFVWLAIALVIDGIDGTFARAVDVKSRLPRFSGERLDLVIDYVTYVFVPVLALVHWKYLDGLIGSLLAAGILLSSLFHFSDEDSKSAENCFVGFPAIWNIVAFYVFALDPAPSITLPIVALLIAATFVPMPWVHPLRVVALRPLTLIVTGVAGIAGFAALANGFPATPLWQGVLVAAALYYSVLAVFWWWRDA